MAVRYLTTETGSILITDEGDLLVIEVDTPPTGIVVSPPVEPTVFDARTGKTVVRRVA